MLNSTNGTDLAHFDLNIPCIPGTAATRLWSSTNWNSLFEGDTLLPFNKILLPRHSRLWHVPKLSAIFVVIGQYLIDLESHLLRILCPYYIVKLPSATILIDSIWWNGIKNCQRIEKWLFVVMVQGYQWRDTTLSCHFQRNCSSKIALFIALINSFIVLLNCLKTIYTPNHQQKQTLAWQRPLQWK